MLLYNYFFNICSSGSDETSKPCSQGKVKLGKQKNGDIDPSPNPKHSHPPPHNTSGVELTDSLAPEPSETLNLNPNESSANSQHSIKKNSQKNSQLEQNCQNSSLVSSFLHFLSVKC